MKEASEALPYQAVWEGEGEQARVVLRGGNLSAAIWPARGANWHSFCVDGEEYMLGREYSDGFGFGSPVLFPCPNRVRGCVFRWRGQSYPQAKNGEPRYLHGLVYDEPFVVEKLEGGEDAAQAVLSFTPEAGSDVLKSFPFPFTLTLIYTLQDNGLRLGVQVENRGSEEMPFGFAIHPYFLRKGDGSGRGVFIRVPAEKRYEAIDLLPTGKLLDVAGTAYDLQGEAREVCTLNLDDVYDGMNAKNTADIEYREHSLTLRLRADYPLRRAVVYTPVGKPSFCIENQTCSTDAHNLYDRGLVNESGLLVLPAGASWCSWIHLGVERNAK